MKFRLPPDITTSKTRVQDQWIYTFRYKEIGELGRIRLNGIDGQTYINFETIGDPDDPMTTKRHLIFEPLGKEIAAQMEMVLGSGVADRSPPPEEKILVKSKMLQCVRCNAFVAMLIFAEDAKAPDRLEDYARLMYLNCSKANLPTWIIGAPLENTLNAPAYILKVWPKRESVRCLGPDEFNPELFRIQESHCL